MRPKGLLSPKRARRLRELMRDTKSAPVDGSTQRKGRARVIGSASPQAANIVLAYYDENARLRAEVGQLQAAAALAVDAANASAKETAEARLIAEELCADDEDVALLPWSDAVQSGGANRLPDASESASRSD